MHEAEALTIRTVLAQHSAALSDEVTALFESLSSSAAAEVERTRQVASRETSQTLNQTVRRIRQAESEAGILLVVAKAALGFAQRAVVVAVEDGQARTIVDSIEEDFAFDLAAARAVSTVVESRDPVVALAAPGEIGVAMDGVSAEEKAYLFPILSRQKVTAILITSGGVAPAPLELFCETAGLKIETLASAAKVAPSFASGTGLIQISGPGIPESAPGERASWDDLSAEDQRLHLHGQRVARVKVAEMRLHHEDALRRGLFEGNVYGALRGEIDAARADFLQTFLAKSVTMVDYLHLEIARSLVHDDERLLGKDYPGPMV